METIVDETPAAPSTPEPQPDVSSKSLIPIPPGASRLNNGGFGGRLAGFGRKKGTPNKATVQIREITRALTLGNKRVIKRLKKQCLDGTINPIIFIKLLEYGYGKVKQTVEVEPGDSSGIKELANAMKQNLSKDELRQMAELTRKAMRGQPIPVDAKIVDATEVTEREIDPPAEPEYVQPSVEE